jgi:hypothetical protein
MAINAEEENALFDRPSPDVEIEINTDGSIYEWWFL